VVKSPPNSNRQTLAFIGKKDRQQVKYNEIKK